MKRFLMIASFPDSLVTFRGCLLDALRVSGCEVHVASPDIGSDSRARAYLESRGIIVHAIPLQRTGLNPIRDLRTVYRLYRLMRDLRPDAILGYTIKPVVYGTLAGWLAGVPKRFVMITGLGYAFTGNEENGLKGRRRLLSWLVNVLYKVALTGTHRIFFQNGDDLLLFRALNLLPPQVPHQVVNGSGIDIDEYRVVQPPPEPLSFLLIARLLVNKGVREFAQAARLVRQEHPDVRFRLVGWLDANPDSITRQELDAWIDAGDIEFLGRLCDVKPAIADCSVYVLPSYREGTPRTVLEAMAMGRAVITSDAPGCRETVVDNINGFLVPVRDPVALAQAMIRFIHNPSLVRTQGLKSRTRAVDKYDVRRVNNDLLVGMGILHDTESPSSPLAEKISNGSELYRSQ